MKFRWAFRQFDYQFFAKLGCLFVWVTIIFEEKNIFQNVTFLAGHYRETRMTSAIIRNNEGYLSQNIEELENILELLHKSGCLTQEQLNNIRCSRPRKQREQKLAETTRSFSAVHYSKFIRCLRHTKQHQVADVAANGGGRATMVHLVIVGCILSGQIWNLLQY